MHEPTSARVQLFTRPGCHLCTEARGVVERVCRAAGVAWDEIDVAAGGTSPEGRPWAELYGELLPVVLVDGQRVGYWQIDPARLAGAVARAGTP